MQWEFKLQQAGLTAEIKAAQRLERKLKKMRDRKSVINKGHEKNRQSVTIAGTNPEGYKQWGNARLLEIQTFRNFLSGQARLFHLAHMFLKGVPYKVVEQTTKSGNQLKESDWETIAGLAESYAEYRKISDDRPLRKFEFASTQDLSQRFEQWKQGF